MKKYKYDVAISFAGEQGEYARRLAQRLTDCGISVFYDSWFRSKGWGKDLKTYLGSIYPEESRFVITIFSKEYCEKYWPMFEYKVMQERRETEDDYILLIVYDGTLPEDWPESRIYIKAEDYSIDEIVLMVRNKIWSENDDNKEEEEESTGDNKLKTMVIKGETGTETVEVILAFEFKDNKKEYVIYTKGERGPDGSVTIYVSFVDRSSGEPVLRGADPADWVRVKEVLWELSQDENGPKGLYNPLDPFTDKDGMEIL